MKEILLTVNGDRFVIEECEGAAEIRRVGAAKAAADRVWRGKVGDTVDEEIHIELKVELRE